MKRKFYLFLAIIFMLSLLSGCSHKALTDSDKKDAQEEAAKPELSQIRSICNLATLECYYHNVAKSTKEKGSGITSFLQKERTFWIEYTATARIGIDMSEIEMEADGTDITITIPAAKLLSCEVADIFSEDYIFTKDGIVENKISAKDQTEAVNQAQENMKNNIENNSTLLASAQNRATKLISNYIEQIGEASGTEYSVHWNYENNGRKTQKQETPAEN